MSKPVPSDLNLCVYYFILILRAYLQFFQYILYFLQLVELQEGGIFVGWL